MTGPTTAPAPTAKKRTITQLSMELIDIPAEEQCFIFEHFEAAIRKGTINAVQDKTGTFMAEYIGTDGQAVKRTCPEEHIEVTEAWKKWLAEQRSASRYHVMKVTQTFVTTPELLHRNQAEFDTLSRLRRQHLQQLETKKSTPPTKASNQKPAQKPPQKPSGTAHSKPKTPAPKEAPTDTGTSGGEQGEARPGSERAPAGTLASAGT